MPFRGETCSLITYDRAYFHHTSVIFRFCCSLRSTRSRYTGSRTLSWTGTRSTTGCGRGCPSPWWAPTPPSLTRRLAWGTGAGSIPGAASTSRTRWEGMLWIYANQVIDGTTCRCVVVSVFSQRVAKSVLLKVYNEAMAWHWINCNIFTCRLIGPVWRNVRLVSRIESW